MPPLDDFWEIELLRVTVFPSDPIPLVDIDWWQRLVGSAPDNQSIDRSAGKLVHAGSVDMDDLHGLLILSIEQGRIDWRITRSPEAGQGKFLGRWNPLVKEFRRYLDSWLDDMPRIRRIAFGAHLMARVSEIEEGNRMLRRFLPFEPATGDRDLLYQSNKRTQSMVANDIYLNRLSKWSVVRIQQVTYSLNQTTLPPRAEDLLTACRLELDINTPADNAGDLANDAATKLLDEMINEASTIASEGVHEDEAENC